MQLTNVGSVVDVVTEVPTTIQIPAATINLSGTIAASGTFVSAALPTFGMPHLAATAKIDQIGTLSIQRYLDAAATITVGAAVTQALVANTQSAVVEVNDGKISQSCKASIINGSTLAATPANLTIVLQSR